MPALVKQLGNAFNKTAGTTLAHTFTGAVSAGNLIIARILFDNAAVASKPIVSSISKQAGETANWVLLGAARSTSTTAGAFASGEMWCIRTTVAWAAASYTVTLDTSVTMKAVSYAEWSDVTATPRSTAGTAYSTTTTAASATTTGTTPQIGDVVFGFIFGSNVAAAQAGDTDTTGGSWSTPVGVGSTGSSAATNNFGIMQYKVLTAASHQTLNNSAAMTAGNGAIVAILQQVPPVAPAARTISAAAGTPAQTAVSLTWADDTAAVPDPTYLIEWSPDGSTGWTTVATGQTGQTGYNVTGLIPDTTYYFRVTGTNSQGSSTSNVAGPITTATYPKIATASETFTNLTAWTTMEGTPTINAGQLQLDHVTGLGEAIQSNALYDMTESSVFCKYTIPGLPATASRTFYLQVRAEFNNYVAIRVIRGPTQANVGGQYNDGGSQGSFPSSTIYNATTMAYLRIRNSGQVFYIDRSADGAAWTNITSRDFGNLTLANKLKSAVIYFSTGQDVADATDPQSSLVDSINSAAPVTGGRPKVYTGAAFTTEPLKVWTGSAWVEKPVKVWTGSAWKTLT